jgi:hypothetical protein
MKSFGRLCIGVGIVGALLVGWARSNPGGFVGPAADIGQLPDLMSQIAVEERLAAELDNKSAALLRANDGKQDIARELLAGRMTLAQAVDCFREIHRSLPIPWTAMRKNYAGCNDAERLGRNVMSWVESEATNNPDQLDVVARLDAELEHYLHENNP